MLYCERCGGSVPGGLKAFQEHLKDHKPPFICANENCFTDRKLYHVKSSFIRHLLTHHQNQCDAAAEPAEENFDEENSSQGRNSDEGNSNEGNFYEGNPPNNTASGVNLNDSVSDENNEANYNEETDDMDLDMGNEMNDGDEAPNDFHTKLESAAAMLVLKLWRHGNVPALAISRVMTEATTLMNSVVSATKDTIIENLRAHDVGEQIINDCVNNISPYDPFRNLKTTEMQLNTFERLYNLVKPEPKPLGRRIEDRTDRRSGLILPVDIAINCQYVSLIKTLTVVLNNPVFFKLIHDEVPSSDGRLRSYLDGSLCKNHPLISKYPHTLRLVKWCDDSEVVNAQGAKTSIHKILTDCFLIQNLPPEENSRLRSIHLSSYSYREDLPEGRGADAVLEPFFAELDQLETEEGVVIPVNGNPFTLRATLIGFAADTLAAHELLGLCSPSANRICSVCLVLKQELHQNILAMGQERTKEVHAKNLEELRTRGQDFSILSSGLKRSSLLIERSTYAEFPGAMIKDPMHDILRGIAPMEIKLVLHQYCIVEKYFEIEDFNAALKSFDCGPADIKNKPSPNFTRDSLKKPVSYVLHQSAAQTWCLLRMFPFIISQFPNVPPNCQYLRLIVLLKKVCDSVFCTEASDADLDRLDKGIVDHHLLFFSLYPPPPPAPSKPATSQQAPVPEEDDSDYDEDFLREEEREDDPPAGVSEGGDVENPRKKQKRKEKVVRPLFKHHYLMHYRKFFVKFGPIILYWCMRFEAKNALTKRFGAICNNFQNLPVTFANLHQFVHAGDLLDVLTPVKEEIQCPKGKSYVASLLPEFPALSEIGILEDHVLLKVTKATSGGFQFRVGLYCALPLSDNDLPMFGKIRSMFKDEKEIIVVTEDVKVSYDDSFASFLIEPTEVDPPTVRAFRTSALPAVRPMLPWPAHNRLYLAPRNLIADMYINAYHDII